MQGAADQAAIAALTTANASGSTANCPSTACTEAEAVAANYGFVNGQSSVSVTVNQPPTQGSHTTSSSAVEVIISQPQSLMFTGLLLSTAPTVQARAVANSATGSMCVMALDTSGKQAIDSVDLGGGTTVNMPNCDLYNDSPVTDSTALSGSASLTARNLFLSGGITEGNNATLSLNGSLKTYVTAMPNPYAGLTIPSYTGCSSSDVKNNTIKTLSGNVTVYCGGISLNSGTTLNLASGTYILDQSGLQVNGGATLTGTGVTIILTSSTGSNYGAVTINGGATVTLTAPTSGATVGTPGVAIWVDPKAPSATCAHWPDTIHWRCIDDHRLHPNSRTDGHVYRQCQFRQQLHEFRDFGAAAAAGTC